MMVQSSNLSSESPDGYFRDTAKSLIVRLEPQNNVEKKNKIKMQF